MGVKLLTEHHLEFLSLKVGCSGSSESTLVINATLLEITCHGSIIVLTTDREGPDQKKQSEYGSALFV